MLALGSTCCHAGVRANSVRYGDLKRQAKFFAPFEVQV